MRRQFSAASLGFGHVVWSLREACPKVQAELERVLARDVANEAKLAAQEAELAGLRSKLAEHGGATRTVAGEGRGVGIWVGALVGASVGCGLGRAVGNIVDGSGVG